MIKKDRTLRSGIKRIGIQAPARKGRLGTSRPGCRLHFMRNIYVKVPSSEKARFVEPLKQIWMQPDIWNAERMAFLADEKYEKNHSEAIHYLEEGLDDSLPSSTNVPERSAPENRVGYSENWVQ
jgi:transposase-like protein